MRIRTTLLRQRLIVLILHILPMFFQYRYLPCFSFCFALLLSFVFAHFSFSHFHFFLLLIPPPRHLSVIDSFRWSVPYLCTKPTAYESSLILQREYLHTWLRVTRNLWVILLLKTFYCVNALVCWKVESSSMLFGMGRLFSVCLSSPLKAGIRYVCRCPAPHSMWNFLPKVAEVVWRTAVRGMWCAGSRALVMPASRTRPSNWAPKMPKRPMDKKLSAAPPHLFLYLYLSFV